MLVLLSYCPFVVQIGLRFSIFSINSLGFHYFLQRYNLGHHLAKKLISRKNLQAQEGLDIFVKGKVEEMKSLVAVGSRSTY